MTCSPAFMLLPLLFALPAIAQPPMPGGPGPTAPGGPMGPPMAPPSSLDAGDRQQIIATLGRALRDRYVFPDVGEQAAAKIEAAHAAGAYDQLTAPAAFAARLAADVNAVAHDKHFGILVGNVMPSPPPGAGGARPPAQAGVVRADKLPGGVGYVEVIGFPHPAPFKQAIDKAMSALAGSSALIVDVRRNGGGAAEAEVYLLSFLVPPGQIIDTLVARTAGTKDFTTRTFPSQPTPVSFTQTPVYVLTSKATFSGGEAFAYGAQALGRGIVIGEVTGGGANPVGPVDLGLGFAAMIPFAREQNPITGTNWEGRGVQPDVSVPATEALAAALRRAGQKPVASIDAASLARVFAPRATPSAGTETAMRGLVAGFASGKPDYTAMTPQMAGMTRQQLHAFQSLFSPLGGLQSLTFHGPDPMGGDEYVLHFANGDFLMALVLDPAGKIMAASSLIPLPR